MAPLDLLRHGTKDGTDSVAGLGDKQQHSWASFLGFAKKTIMKDKEVAAIGPKIEELVQAALCANRFIGLGVRPI